MEVTLTKWEKLDLAKTVWATMVARPASEYHEDMGAVLWWRLENVGLGEVVVAQRWAGEPPYIGSPNDMGIGVRLEISAVHGMGKAEHNIRGDKGNRADFYVGGWIEDYYTHFTPIVIPELPK